MNIIQFVRILWARRLIILAATIGCVVGAFIVTQIVPPRYQGKSRIIMEMVKPDPLTGQVTGGQFARAYTKTQIELIKDYRVAGAVVDQLGWMNDLNLGMQYQARPSSDERDMRRWLAQRIIDGTNAELIDGSNILEITYTSNTPEAARTIADSLRTAYIDSSLAFRRQSASRTADWFAEQTEKAKAELARAEAAKAAFEKANGIILQDGKIDTDSARLAALASASGSPMIAPMIAAPSAAGMQLAQLDAAIAQASRALGPNHPDLIAMKQQRTMLAGQAAQEQRAANSAAGAAASAARVGAGMLEAQKSKVIGQREKLEQLRALQAEVDLRRDQFMKSASRSAELRQEAEIGEVGLTALGSAITPQKPVFPNMPLIMFGALGLGLGFGLLIALLTEFLGRRIRSVEDLDAAIDAPLLAVIATPPNTRRKVRTSWFGLGRRSFRRAVPA